MFSTMVWKSSDNTLLIVPHSFIHQSKFNSSDVKMEKVEDFWLEFISMTCEEIPINDRYCRDQIAR